MPRGSLIVNTPNQAYGSDKVTHEQVTVSSSALQLPAQLTAGELNKSTQHVLLQVNGADLRVTFDGATDPTSSLGFKMVAGTEAYWSYDQFRKARAIRAGSTDATLEVQEMGYKG